MRIIIFYLTLIVLFSCSSRKNVGTSLTVDLKLDSITSRINFKDFKYNNIKIFDSIDCWSTRDLKSLTDTVLLNKWFGLEKEYLYNFYDIHLLSVQKSIGFLLPLIFTQTGSDYGAIVLKLIDTRNGRVVNTFELNGGECGGPGEMNNGIWILCGKNNSLFLNDSTINNIKVKFYCDSLTDESDMRIDTIKYLLTIDRIKGLLSKKIDSIRINTKEKNYVR